MIPWAGQYRVVEEPSRPAGVLTMYDGDPLVLQGLATGAAGITWMHKNRQLRRGAAVDAYASENVAPLSVR